jgi:Family of unknown function (DUF6455)
MTQNKDEFTPVEIVQFLGVQPEPIPVDHQTGMASHLAARALAAIDELRQRHRLRREMEGLEDGGMLDRVLAEAQLTRADIETMLGNYPASGHLLDEMAERLHIADEVHEDRLVERDLRHVCTLCSTQGRCRHWLASGRSEGFEAFCPNADQLRAMRDLGEG